jgi:hypothetical protein
MVDELIVDGCGRTENREMKIQYPTRNAQWPSDGTADVLKVDEIRAVGANFAPTY